MWKTKALGSWIAIACLLHTAGGLSSEEPPRGEEGAIEVTLCGSRISIDRMTGGLIRFEHPPVGRILEASPERSSLLDLAYPIPEFDPLRLAPRFSKGASVEVGEGEVRIAWEELGPSRPFQIPGKVSATVRLREATDERSIVLTCILKNDSPQPIKQVLFPDLMGLLPFAGEKETQFRSGGCVLSPFLDLRTSALDRFYATNANVKILRSGDLNDTEMVIRWMDLGGLSGGFSLFPRRWGWDPQTRVLLQLSDSDHRLRLMNEHTTEIGPGQEWSSGEYWLTPHAHGWAKGIEPYRDWARKNMRREYPLPNHVRKGLGFRSIWMCQNQPNDPRDAVWRFSDLVPLAEDAKAHGLDEMVMWIWHKPFVLPFPPPYPHLGTEGELIDAVRRCREIGINVAPFISVLQAEHSTAERYGLAVSPESGNWTYHTEFLPKFNPPYASRFACVQVDTTDPRWQKDVLDSCRNLIEKGMPSLCWDQYWSVLDRPNLNTLTSQIRQVAKKMDPESTFSGEELKNFEINSNHLDYTWNWGQHENLQALVSVFPAPRINVNINHSVETVKRCFADNLYANVWPMKPDSVNGSDWIANDVELSRTLKQCASQRERFLEYFTEGTFIGDCVLARPCEGRHVSAYVLPGKMLILTYGMEEGDSQTLSYDLEPWLNSPSGTYRMRSYDPQGNESASQSITGGTWDLKIPMNQHHDLLVYEWVTP